MFKPTELPIGCSANAPFSDDIWEVPIDLTDQSILMQVRMFPGAEGDPLIDLSSATAAPADRIEIIMTSASYSQFRPVIAEETLDALPKSGRAGKPVTFAHDILIGAAGFERPFLFGDFTVKPGVTRNA